MLRYALIALAIIGALTGLTLAWKSYTGGLIEEGYQRGREEVTADVAQRDNAQLVATLEHLRLAQKHAHDLTVQAAKDLAAQAAAHEKEKTDAEAKTDSLVAAVRRGDLVLRDPGGPAAGPAGGGERAAAGGAAAGPGASQAGKSKLSGEASAFLLSLSAEADMLAFRYNRLLTAYGTLDGVCHGD